MGKRDRGSALRLNPSVQALIDLPPEWERCLSPTTHFGSDGGWEDVIKRMERVSGGRKVRRGCGGDRGKGRAGEEGGRTAGRQKEMEGIN